ncbi:MAG: response regulator [Candidatus Omnitrophica bacterium]|nr:response regulator [Candidatus Omnitrophota bacterium]
MAKDILQILLVEDDPGDVGLVRKALDAFGGRVLLHVVGDGLSALNFVRCEAPYQNAPRPDLILLDLNLPMKTGQEVLREIRQDSKFARIPVLILTTSESEIDITAAYRAGANCFVSKPMVLGEFMQTVQSMVRYWMRMVSAP